MYDPRACGAQCDSCPLRGTVVVPPESNPGARICVVGEAPGAEEVREGRPFVGPSGQELQRSLGSARLFRRDLHLTNVILCQPPKNELDNLLARISAENREREKRNKAAKKAWEGLVKHQPWLTPPHYEALIPTPQECCAPRLQQEVAGFRDFITLGGTAAKAIMGTPMSILSLRGGMAELDAGKGMPARRVMPTVHPSFVLRAPRWSHVFRSDLHRARRWFQGGLAWVPPEVTYHPDPDQLEAFLTRTVPYWTYDLETDGIEPLTANIRCVGIGSPDGRVALVGLLGKDGVTKFYPEAVELQIIDILKRFFLDPTKLKVGHNCLHLGTPVILADGTSAAIEELVRGRYSGEVKALNASGEIVAARVTGWFRTTREGQEWLTIRRVGEKAHARGLTLTPDHEVYTTRGRVRADALVVGDSILSGERHLMDDERQALLGSLLGDSSALSATTKAGAPGEGVVDVRRLVVTSATACVRGNHTDEALVRQKNEWLGGLLHIHQEQRGGGYAPDSRAWAYRTPQLRQTADIARLVYGADGKRHIGRAVLDALGPVGLAWLYADDGFKHKRPERKKEAMLIATCGFAPAEIEEARAWFTDMFGATTITAAGSLRLSVEASQAFAAHIAPFLLPAARYKLPKGSWPDFVGFPIRSSTPHAVEISSIEVFTPPTTTPTQKFAARTRWCLQTTEGNFLTGFGFVKNCGSYDSNVLRATWGVWPAPQMDTIMLHRLVESELPHNLGFVGSLYTDAPAWKTDRDGNKLAFGAETDEQLHSYCATDVAVTSQVLPPLFDAVKTRGQAHLIALDHQVQRICADMHRVGMYVDQAKRQTFELKYIKEAAKRLDDLRGVAPTADFNPGSPHQIRRILFDQWGLVSPLDEKERTTASGDPATSDDVLRSLLTLAHLTDGQRDFILKLRRYRKAQKLLGTYIVKLRPTSEQAELGWDDDEDWEDAEMRKKYGIERTGIVDPRTGRMYPGYNAHVAVTGRLSSSKPINAQNFPKGLRAMVTPEKGRVFIGADADQLELRIAAALWGAERYLRAFDANADPHSSTALACFGERFRRAEGFPGGKWDGDLFIPDGTGKWSGDAKTFRDLAKRVQYACLAADTRVVTTGAEGEKRIADLTPQDTLWCWSKARSRYESGRVVRAWKTGTRRVQRVTLKWWAGPRAGWRTTSVVLTPDHLCLLRDGTFRAAGNLQPGDRVMPFTRRLGTPTKDGRAYRYLFPHNDKREVSEHRVLAGFYVAGEGDTHVHHKDETTANNNPENLEPLHYRDHFEKHREDMAAGRRASSCWRASVSDAETRRKATQKSWAGGCRKKPSFSSMLDGFRALVGTLPDKDLAEKAGCTPENVAYYRKKHGIGKPPTQRGGIQERVLLLREKLGVLRDQEIAEIVGCDRANVARVRMTLGIARPPRRGQQDPLDAWGEQIGHTPDAALAAEAGCSVAAVAAYRTQRGIPAYWETCPEGTNHTVVAVEDAGEEEVWDVEVDHEDHNFALSAGLFVHNSQYMATVETVHRVICQTETPNEDGTTSLPYLRLGLSEVRDMHQAWLDGCPEFPKGWDREIREWQRQGYLVEPITGRRRDFLDGENPNELVNFKVQGGAAGLMNKAIIALAERVKAETWGHGTGIINQCHDALVLEVPADGAYPEKITNAAGKEETRWHVPEGSIPWRVMQDLGACMNQVHPALPGVKITATPDIGLSWKEVG